MLYAIPVEIGDSLATFDNTIYFGLFFDLNIRRWEIVFIIDIGIRWII